MAVMTLSGSTIALKSEHNRASSRNQELKEVGNCFLCSQLQKLQRLEDAYQQEW